MNKKQFYKDKIIWKAKNNLLLSQNCVMFNDLPEETQQKVTPYLDQDDEPILALFEKDTLWTVVGCNKIYSYNNNRLEYYCLDKINKNIMLISPQFLSKDENLKLTSCYLKLNNEAIIWAPEGKEIFSLWNLLKMFPLNKH